jgi:hypothetical protein
MTLLRRVVGAVVLLLSALVFVCCVAAIVGTWMVRQQAVQKVETVAGRIDNGLERTTAVTQNIQGALKKAHEAVLKVRNKSNDLGDGAKGPAATLVIRTLVRQEVGPNVNNLGGRLATVTDATVVAASLLQSLQEMPFLSDGHIHPEKLEAAAAQVSLLSDGLQQLQSVVGEGDTPASQRDVADAANAIDEVLSQCQSTLGEWQAELDAAQQDVARIKTRINQWLLLAALVVTVASAWVALSQVSLFVHAWGWCRGGQAP